MSGQPVLRLATAPLRAGGVADGGGDRFERALLRGLLLALIAEGRRFAVTPAGERWRRVLGEGSLARDGRAGWGAAGLDLFLSGADRGPGSPRAMADDILALLAAEDAGSRAPGLRVTVAGAGGRG